MALLVVLALGLASVAFRGRNASSKFSAVGYAIDGGGVVNYDAGKATTGGDGGNAGDVAGATARSPIGPQAPVGVTPSTGSPSSTASPLSTASPSSPGKPGASLAKVDVLAASPAALGHSFVSSATISIRADRVNETKEKAIALAEGAGGGFFGESSNFGQKEQATITLKVPPERFRPMLTDLARLGALTAEEVKTDDVTQQVIDLDARIKIGEQVVERSELVLEKATAPNDISNAEAALVFRQTELENLRGQQKTLSQRVDLATIQLTIQSGVTEQVPVQAASGAAQVPVEDHQPGFIEGLRTGWGAFLRAGTAVLAVVGVVLPFLPFVVPAGVVLHLTGRRRRTRRRQPQVSGAAA